MRHSLIWLLGATVLASAVALILQRPTIAVVQAVQAARGAQNLSGSELADAVPVAKLPLPPALRRWEVEPATRDPFAEAPVAPPPLPQPVPPPVALVIAAPPPPAPPPLAWRYLGAFDTPDGKRLVMLTRQNNDSQAVIVERGTRLDDGYEVLAVSNEAIRLLYPPLQSELVITIPPPPASDR